MFAGLALALGGMIGAALLFFLAPMEAEPQQSGGGGIPGLYLSAVAGPFQRSTGDGQWSDVVAGDDLAIGFVYRTDADGEALLRSSMEELEITVSNATVFGVGGEIDPSDVTLVAGELLVRSTARSGAPLVLDLGETSCRLPDTATVRVQRADDLVDIQVLRGVAQIPQGAKLRTIEAGGSGHLKAGELNLAAGIALQAPPLFVPVNGAILRKNLGQPLPIDLQWGEVENADSYQVEIATDTLFRAVAISRRTRETRLTLADSGEGMYYWRVTALGRQNASGETSLPATFSVNVMINPDEEAVSAPELTIDEVSAQSNLISVRGQTEPGARVFIYLESLGVMVSEPREVPVDPTGSFRMQIEAPEKGELYVVAQAYYRPEFMTRKSATVFVDF
jgi:hypothetical protein